MGREFIELNQEVTAAILITLLAGWSYASIHQDVNNAAGEVLMTERLRDGMRFALKSGAYPWSKTLIVLPGTESRSRETVLIPDGRTDIPLMLIEIFLRTGEHDPHAIVECKRVAANDARLCREYIKEGIDRFRSGKYGLKHGVGFMVGYLLAGTADAVVAAINAYLRGARANERLRVADAQASKWYSTHPRRAPRPAIDLNHCFLQVRDSVVHP